MEPVQGNLNILRGGPSNKMKALVVAKEADLLTSFNELTQDDDWVIFSLIRNSKNPEVKLELTELLVSEEVEEGDFFGAVFALTTLDLLRNSVKTIH